MKNPVYILLISLGTSLAGLGQSGLISGRVIDSQTQEPLPFAHIFINNTTIGTTTDIEGKFSLKNVPVGANEVIYSFVGYQSYSARVTVAESQTAEVVVRLIPILQELSNVEVKSQRDKEWMRQLKYFEKQFFGEEANNQCKITNPWVIDFAVSDKANGITAQATAPIEITNQYLGYTIMFHLKKFQSNNQGYMIDGNAYFIELDDPQKKDLWIKNRAEVYYGSDRHLFKAILNERVEEEGFRLYVDKKGEQDLNIRSNLFYSEVGKKVVEFNTKSIVTQASRPYEFNIQFNGRTEVHYLNELAGTRYYKDVTGQVSWIEVKGNALRVNNNGVVLNPGNAVYSGEMSGNRIGTLLPLDYQPQPGFASEATRVQNDNTLLREKVYIHTDKPYYYPGETIWFKGYLAHNQTDIQDSVSNVLYVELINSRKEIVQRKILKLDSGVAHSYFMLPDSLARGNYMLRSYTSWMQNFGDPCFFVTPIPILALSEKLEPNPIPNLISNSLLTVVPDKKTYRPREKIQLIIETRDKNFFPVKANLSISVTDEKQVSMISEQETILTGLHLPELPRPSRLSYPVEQGLHFSGLVKDEKHKPMPSNLTIVVGNFEDVLTLETDPSGKFELKDLEYYESVEFSFQANDKRGKHQGHISLTPAHVPPVSAWKEYKKILIVEAGSVQRLLSEYESSRDVILMDEVTITGKRIEVPAKEIEHQIFGDADYVVTGGDLTASGSGNLVLALRGRVPGLTIGQESDGKGGFRYTIKIRGAASFTLDTEPLVLFNGIPVGGGPGESAADRLAQINPGIVDRVEVTTRSNSMYGAAGRNGVIAVFTKTDNSSSLPDKKNGKSLNVFKLQGFSRPGNFRSPVYTDPAIGKDKPDYRSTVYWNPQLITQDDTGQVVVNFFATDLSGRYRVIVQGVTSTGEPVCSETFIVIEN